MGCGALCHGCRSRVSGQILVHAGNRRFCIAMRTILSHAHLSPHTGIHGVGRGTCHGADDKYQDQKSIHVLMDAPIAF